jgi:DNA-directed RNA polymerase alpha subunit
MHIVEAITDDSSGEKGGQQKVQELQADIEKLELQEMLYDDLQARCFYTVGIMLLRCCRNVVTLLLHYC